MLKDNYKKLKAISAFQENIAKSTGFDWPGPLPVIDKLMEEIDELKEAVTKDFSKDKIAEEYGDILFVLLNLANHLTLDPDKVLAQSFLKFQGRFNRMILLSKEKGLDFKALSLGEQERLWSEVKAMEASTD